MLKSLFPLLLPLFGSLVLASTHQPASGSNDQYSCFEECVKAHGGHSTFKKDCNFCSCTQSGSVICTLMACPPPPPANPDKYHCYDECVKANGGPTFKRDCNTCTCLKDGGVSCTEMACPSPQPPPPPPPPPPPANPDKYHCYDECVRANGGPTFKRDCNTCTCLSDGGVACTLMLCPDD